MATPAQLAAASAAMTAILDKYIAANVPSFFQDEAASALKSLMPQLAQAALDAAEKIPSQPENSQ